MSVSIFIDYKLINDTQWHTIEMSPENYFDLYLDEKIRWDCVPKYDKVIDYLNVDRKQVLNTRLRIIDDEASVTKIITTTFWDQGENTIAERLVRGLEKLYWLMVITTKVQDNPAVWEILRLQKENDVPIVEFHSFITDNEDGSETEKIIYPIRED
ncbi:hypothetical protein [Microcoleus sp. B4-D4]|uniref:hypothetical protein n=1 Tax=Microcoleus sp. B4-D4 TaxID=2818667 RepID=UPI002FD1CCD3